MNKATTVCLGRQLTLNRYLKYCKKIMKKVRAGTYDMTWRTLVINMGNMSGDSDSICGSICLAYYHFMKANGKKKIYLEDADIYHIPLMNLTKDAFSARFESLYILETYDVDIDSILTLDDVNLEHFMEHANTHMILYDHNVPNSNQQFLNRHISGIVDHHLDESDTYIGPDQQVTKEIRYCMMDSGTTIIARMIFEKIHREFEENRIIKLDMSVLHMLRLVMYIDSKEYHHELKGVRYQSGNHKFWLKFCRFITKHGGEDIRIPMLIHKKMHTQLRWDLQKHVNELSWKQVLEKDYKSYTFGIGNVGLAIIRGKLKEFEDMTNNAEKFVKDVLGFMDETNLAVVSVGCYAKPIRRFIIFAKDPKHLEKIVKNFEKNKVSIKSLKFDHLKHPHVVFEEVNKQRFTRKKLAPAMREACKIDK